MAAVATFIHAVTAFVLHTHTQTDPGPRPAPAAAPRAASAGTRREDFLMLLEHIDQQRGVLAQSLLKLGTTRATLLYTVLPQTLSDLSRVQGVALADLEAGHLEPLTVARQTIQDKPLILDSPSAQMALALYGDARIRTADLSWLLGWKPGPILLGQSLSPMLRAQLEAAPAGALAEGVWTADEWRVLTEISARLSALRASAEGAHADLWRTRRAHASLVYRLQTTLRLETDYTVLRAISGLRTALSPSLQIIAAVRSCQEIFSATTQPLQNALDVEPLPPLPANTALVIQADAPIVA